MWVVHHLDKFKASEKTNAWFQKPAEYKNKNQNAEWGKRHFELLENLQAYLMSDMELSKNEVDQLILAYSNYFPLR